MGLKHITSSVSTFEHIVICLFIIEGVAMSIIFVSQHNQISAVQEIGFAPQISPPPPLLPHLYLHSLLISLRSPPEGTTVVPEDLCSFLQLYTQDSPGVPNCMACLIFTFIGTEGLCERCLKQTHHGYDCTLYGWFNHIPDII